MFTGDLFLGGDLRHHDTTSAVRSPTFSRAGVRIVNLEGAISDNAQVAQKCTLYCGSQAANTLAVLDIQAVSGANNHIHDKMESGIGETADHVSAAGVSFFGAGRNLDEAKRPVWISSSLCVIGYCAHSLPFLKDVKLAGENSPGVNPLTIRSVCDDLDALPRGAQAILFFHWGREHAWLPPYRDIALARKLLDDPRVLLIVGTHAHRAQGYVEHNGKRAYLSLGNFLFPNFCMAPPHQLAPGVIAPVSHSVTQDYHKVTRMTYKKWRTVNRISLMVQYESENRAVRHIPMMQADRIPTVTEMNGLARFLVLVWVWGLSCVYRLPAPLYRVCERIDTFISLQIRKGRFQVFRLRERGPRWCIARAVKALRDTFSR